MISLLIKLLTNTLMLPVFFSHSSKRFNCFTSWFLLLLCFFSFHFNYGFIITSFLRVNNITLYFLEFGVPVYLCDIGLFFNFVNCIIYLFKHTFILFACLLIHLSSYYINITWVIFYWMVYLLICNALADEKESFGTHKTWDIGRFICACVWIMSCNFSLDFSHSSYSMLANLFLHFFGFLLFFSFPPSSYSIYVVIF